MIEILAALSISAAAGIRVALPLLLIGMLRSDILWTNMPILSRVPPSVVVGVLVSWSLVELMLSKDRLMHRFLQTIQLGLGPIAGAIAGIGVARTVGIEPWIIPLVGITGGVLALVLQLVQVGWFYRIHNIPLWVIFAQDVLCVSLAIFAFDAPGHGGLLALLLLWLAIRSSKEWQRWYRHQAKPDCEHDPRQGKDDPD